MPKKGHGQVQVHGGQRRHKLKSLSCTGFSACANNSPIESLYWGRNVNSFDYAYQNSYDYNPILGPVCEKLQRITIGEKVNYIFLGRMYQWKSLKEMKFNDSSTPLSIKGEDLPESSIEAVHIGRDLSGTFGFWDCGTLREVTFGESVTCVKAGLFSGCSKLSGVKLPAGVKSIGASAFNKCVGLKEIELPNSVTTLGEYAFSHCKSLTNVLLSDSISCIPVSCFSDCESLSSITIPGSVTAIERYGFNKCVNLTHITIPSTIVSIGDNAFNGCSSLRSLNIEDSPMELQLGSPSSRHNLFYDCPLEKIYLGRNIVDPSENRQYFSSFPQLSDVTVGGEVTKLEDTMFKGCNSLSKVTIKDSPNILNLNYGCQAFQDSPIQTMYVGRRFSRRINLPTVEVLHFGREVTSISVNAFSDMSNLKELYLPGSIRQIGEKVFAGCKSLESVTVTNPIPPVIEESTFSELPKTATLYFPNHSKLLYWLHPFWGQFAKMDVFKGEGEISQDLLTYTITSEEGSTVEVSNLSSKSRSGNTTFSVPSEIYFNDKTYYVGGIANKAFEGMQISSVHLPQTISYIGQEAFKDVDLNEIQCEAPVPPSVAEDTFSSDTYENATLVVNEVALKAYKSHAVWRKFASITARVPVTEIILSPENVELSPDEEIALQVMVLPENASNYTLMWQSSNDDVAVVSEDGLVKAIAEGTCEIIVRTADNSNVEAICLVKVGSACNLDIMPTDTEDTGYAIFNLSGLKVTNNLESLTPGLYFGSSEKWSDGKMRA